MTTYLHLEMTRTVKRWLYIWLVALAVDTTGSICLIAQTVERTTEGSDFQSAPMAVEPELESGAERAAGGNTRASEILELERRFNELRSEILARIIHEGRLIESRAGH